MSNPLRLLTLLLFGVLSAAAPAPAPEMPLKNEAALRRIATHVVVGEVRRVWTAEAKEGSHRYRHAIAEVALEAVETAASDAPLKPGELVYARWFTRSWAGWGEAPADSNGHYGWTPERGDRVRAFLARKAYDGFATDNEDGGYNVIVPNGFVKLDEK